jgi:hypothetical protein
VYSREQSVCLRETNSSLTVIPVDEVAIVTAQRRNDHAAAWSARFARLAPRGRITVRERARDGWKCHFRQHRERIPALASLASTRDIRYDAVV